MKNELSLPKTNSDSCFLIYKESLETAVESFKEHGVFIKFRALSSMKTDAIRNLGKTAD